MAKGIMGNEMALEKVMKPICMAWARRAGRLNDAAPTKAAGVTAARARVASAASSTIAAADGGNRGHQ